MDRLLVPARGTGESLRCGSAGQRCVAEGLCLLQVAHRRAGAAAFAGLYSPLWRKRMLEDRIRYIVHASRATAPRWPALATSAVLLCALVLLGGARWKQMPSNEQTYQRFVGTWVNLASLGNPQRSRVTVIRPDYVGEDRPLPASSKVLDGRWTIKIKKIWVDDKGNTYCQFFGRYVEGSTGKFAALMRVDEKGKVWELCCQSFNAGDVTEHTAAYPERVDPNLRGYYTYYRKK